MLQRWNDSPVMGFPLIEVYARVRTHPARGNIGLKFCHLEGLIISSSLYEICSLFNDNYYSSKLSKFGENEIFLTFLHSC